MTQLLQNITASSVAVGLLYLLVLLSITLHPMTFGNIPTSRRFIVSAQGKNRCPEVWYTGPKRVLVLRSHLECAKTCTSWSECLHYSYHRSNKSCTLYSMTPTNLYPAADCVFMLDPSMFEGCFSAASLRTHPDGCNLPFQYSNKEFYGCMDTTYTTSQCGAANGQLADCIAPPGYSVQQDIVNWTTITSAPLPCINNWIILMQRFDGSVNFTQNWSTYKNGFGGIRGTTFWIGNENIHLITNTSAVAYRLRVEVQTFTNGRWYYAEYNSFRVDSEANWYALHLDGYQGNAGDSFANMTSDQPSAIQNGMNFSTYDSDHDLKTVGSCALMFKAGFWFNDCSLSCLTCMNGTIYFAWYSLNDYGFQDQGKLRAARMMIRSL